jgi:response regulator RpfG family c-di-GMP phosphodiesterase
MTTATTPAASAQPRDGPVVLLVDDQLIIGEAVRHILATQKGITFHFCQKGQEALATAARLKPTVILQDLVMPDADGLDLVRGYRQQEATALTPLIVLSSNEEGTTKAKAFANGANDYLVKLPHPVELLARIQYHSRSYYAHLQAREFAESERRRQDAERRAEMLNARNTLIFALAKLAESRDSDTGEHLERIAAYSRVLGEQLRASLPELTDQWILNLQLASSLHDIGKVGIPDAVLLKAGTLTQEERAVINRHPTIGAEALNAILARQPDDDTPLDSAAPTSRSRRASSASRMCTMRSPPGACTSPPGATQKRWRSSPAGGARSSIRRLSTLCLRATSFFIRPGFCSTTSSPQVQGVRNPHPLRRPCEPTHRYIHRASGR